MSRPATRRRSELVVPAYPVDQTSSDPRGANPADGRHASPGRPPSLDADAFARLAHQMNADLTEPAAAATIVALAVRTLPDADHASLRARTRRGDHRALGSSSAAATRADDAERELHEGPGVEGGEDAAQVDWLRSGDLRADVRWPAWGPRAAGLGLHSLLSIPLGHGTESAAVLTLYSDSSGAFGTLEVREQASLFATHAASAWRAAHLVTGLHAAIDARHTIGLAQGMLMERDHLGAQQAFDLLSRVASRREVKLRLVAEGLLATGRLGDL